MSAPDLVTVPREVDQPSIATKQESCPESATRTETEIVTTLRECQRVLAMMIDPASIKSTSVIHAFAAATEAEAKARTVLNGVTKSDEAAGKHPIPSVSGNTDREQQRDTLGVTAGETAPNSAPNHQPHAVSQGWRTDLENAPGGVRFLIAGRYPNGIWYVEESYRHYAGHFNGRKIDPPTHWMPLPAPPSPAKTGGAE